MRYEKAIVVDLSGHARASGMVPLCFSGNEANREGEICYAGPYPFATHCITGTEGWMNCVGGATPEDGADCYPGGTPFWCAGGMTGSADPSGCANGPEADIHS